VEAFLIAEFEERQQRQLEHMMRNLGHQATGTRVYLRKTSMGFALELAVVPTNADPPAEKGRRGMGQSRQMGSTRGMEASGEMGNGGREREGPRTGFTPLGFDTKVGVEEGEEEEEEEEGGEGGEKEGEKGGEEGGEKEGEKGEETKG
jgi:hypothetical protein